MPKPKTLQELSERTGLQKHRKWDDAIDEINRVADMSPGSNSFVWSGFTGVVDLSSDTVNLNYSARLGLDFACPGTKFEFWYEKDGEKSEVITVDGGHRNYATITIKVPKEPGIYWVQCMAYRLPTPYEVHKGYNQEGEWIRMNGGSYRVRIQ